MPGNSKRTVKATSVAKGTILFSHCQYNGIVIEYRLNQFRQEYYELYVFPKIINTNQDYNIGLTLSSDSDITRSEQKTLIYNKVVRHPLNFISKQHKTIMIANGVRKLLNCCDGSDDSNTETCALVGAFKLKFRIKKLDDLDLWIAVHGLPQSHKNYQLIKIPNLINYIPPRKNATIYQAYPLFREKLKSNHKKWWLSAHYGLVQEVKIPTINWRDIFHEAQIPLDCSYIIRLIRKIIYRAGQSYPGILSKLGLKNLKLETRNKANFLRIDNLGPELQIHIQDAEGGQIVDLPEKTNAFDFLIDGFDIVVRLIDEKGPIIYQHNIDSLNATIDYVEQITGFWIYITNSYPYNIQTLIEFNCLEVDDMIHEGVESTIPASTKQRKWFDHPFGQLDYSLKIYLINHDEPGSDSEKILLSQKTISPKNDKMTSQAVQLAQINNFKIKRGLSEHISESIRKKMQNDSKPTPLPIEEVTRDLEDILEKQMPSNVVTNTPADFSEPKIKLQLSRRNIDLIQNQKKMDIITAIKEIKQQSTNSEPSEHKTEKTTEDKTEKTTEDKTEKTTEDKTEKTTEDKTEKTTEDKTEKTTEDKTGKLTEDKTGKTIEDKTGKTIEDIPESEIDQHSSGPQKIEFADIPPIFNEELPIIKINKNVKLWKKPTLELRTREENNMEGKSLILPEDPKPKRKRKGKKGPPRYTGPKVTLSLSINKPTLSIQPKCVEVEAETGGEAEAEVEAETGGEAEAEVEAETGSEAGVEAKAEAETGVEAEVEAGVEAEAGVEVTVEASG